MPSTGKIVRLNRFFLPSSRVAIIAACDHGLTLGPIDGIESVDAIARWIRTPGITGVIGHKGMIERIADRGLLNGLGIMVHLNGMTAHGAAPNQKELVTRIETAVRLGADAVSVQLNFDRDNDAHNLRLLGQIVDEALRFDLPVMPMLYDVQQPSERHQRTRRLCHLIRVAIELGADAIKIAAPSTSAEIEPLLSAVASDVPVFLAGGERGDAQVLLDLLRDSLRWGARGLCVGRNLFQRKDPHVLLGQLQQIASSAAAGALVDVQTAPKEKYLEASA